MLVRRGKVWSAKLRIAGTQVWKSLQTSDFELAVVRLRWLQASVTATRFEQKTATHEGLIVTIKQNLDAIVRQWAQEQLEVTEQAKAESSGFDPSDLDDQKDVYGDLLEAAHEHLTESHNGAWRESLTSWSRSMTLASTRHHHSINGCVGISFERESMCWLKRCVESMGRIQRLRALWLLCSPSRHADEMRLKRRSSLCRLVLRLQPPLQTTCVSMPTGERKPKSRRTLSGSSLTPT